VVEGSDLDVRRRQLQALLTAGGYTSLAACSAGREARVHGFTTGTSEIDPSSPSSRSLVAGPMKR
jgi:hypothetical protein